MIYVRFLVSVRWTWGRNTEFDYYDYPEYVWRIGSQRRPATPIVVRRRSGDQRFGGWSC